MSVPLALVVGTRPEAIKLSPVVRAAADHGFAPVVVSTAQQADLLGPTLAAVEVDADVVVAPGTDATLTGVAGHLVAEVGRVLRAIAPAAVVVQGDTTTALAAGLAGHYGGLPVAHVEAGLRSGDLAHPFPEEANRRMVDRIATWCFAPTEGAAAALRREDVDEGRIHVTGNTGIDALLWALDRVGAPPPDPDTLLVTLHRRESAGQPFLDILGGVGDFLADHPDARVVWPVHPNPAVAAAVAAVPDLAARAEMVPPLGYLDFVRAMAASRVILSDSGGVQEEAPSLGRRVLVVRETTERPEAVGDERSVLVGRSRRDVHRALGAVWAAPPHTGPLPAPNPFGDGRAAARILAVMAADLLG